LELLYSNTWCGATLKLSTPAADDQHMLESPMDA